MQPGSNRLPFTRLHLMAFLLAATLVFQPLWIRTPTAASSGPRPITLAQAGAATVDVTLQNFSFQPAVLVIQAGTTVRWTHADGPLVVHSTASDTAIWDSGPLSNGQTYSVVFNTTGVYTYHCAFHPLLMTGTIIVVKPVLYLPMVSG